VVHHYINTDAYVIQEYIDMSRAKDLPCRTGMPSTGWTVHAVGIDIYNSKGKEVTSVSKYDTPKNVFLYFHNIILK
jgi:hypothetical protein